MLPTPTEQIDLFPQDLPMLPRDAAIDAIFANVAAGRGFWAGLYPDTFPIVMRSQCLTCRRYLVSERAQDGSDPQVCVECRATSLVPTLPGIELASDGDAHGKAPHITLAHFGRRLNAIDVERVITACRRAVDPGPGMVVARSWATARMDQSKASVVALLLEGEQLHAFRKAFQEHCTTVGVRVDDRFEFHPHCTLSHLGLKDTAEIASRPKIELTFKTLSLVCGTARMDLSLGTMPF